MATKKFNLQELCTIRNSWKDIPEEALPVSKQTTFDKRKIAIDMYIDGEPVSEIQQRTGIKPANLIHYLERCLKTKTNGEYFGYEALIPSHRVKNEKSFREFGKLLSLYPSLKEFISGNYFGDKKYTLEKNMNIVTLHGKFLQELRRLGVKEDEYPFDTENRAYAVLARYVKTLQEDISAQAKRESKDAKQKLLSTGIGIRYTRNSLVPFQTVQIDGHKIDMQYTVEILNVDGTIDKVIADRAWLIAVVDVATRCILGYSISQEINYNQFDIIDAVIDAISPKEKMDFSIDGLRYPENGGFYSLAFPELRYVYFDEIMLDNAKSHLSQYTVSKLTQDLKAVVNIGSVATPETRGIIERFFGTLETTGFHKLPVTTGSHIRDKKRNNPERAAVRYDVTYKELKELTESLIAEYNNTPHSGIRGLTPLQAMEKKVYEAGLYPCLIEDDDLKVIHRLRMRTETRIVRGKTEHGKRPYISFFGAVYRSPELSTSGIFLGKEITIEYDPRDISTVEAYSDRGIYIGTLTARGEFGTKSHSVKTRKNAMKLARQHHTAKLEFNTPISAYEEHLNKKGKKSKKCATQADIVRQEQGKGTYSETEASNRRQKKIVPIKQDTPVTEEHPYEELIDLTLEEVYDKLFGKDA